MSDSNSPDYYRRREQQERALAAGAISPTIGTIHLELAERYAALADEGASPVVRPRLKLAYS